MWEFHKCTEKNCVNLTKVKNKEYGVYCLFHSFMTQRPSRLTSMLDTQPVNIFGSMNIKVKKVHSSIRALPVPKTELSDMNKYECCLCNGFKGNKFACDSGHLVCENCIV